MSAPDVPLNTRRPRQPGRAALSGLTLLEMLITLVLVGAVSGLLLQTLNTIVGLESRLDELRGETEERLLQRYWVQQLLETTVPARMAASRRFVGEPLGLSAWVADPPWPQVAGPLWTELRLREHAGAWALEARTAGLPTWVVATGLEPGAFEYLVETDDGDLEWRPNWTPTDYGLEQFEAGRRQAEATVPRAIRLRGAAPWLELLVVVRATRNPQLSRAQLERLDP